MTIKQFNHSLVIYFITYHTSNSFRLVYVRKTTLKWREEKETNKQIENCTRKGLSWPFSVSVFTFQCAKEENRSNIVKSSVKILKMVHIKEKKKFQEVFVSKDEKE